MGWGRFRTVAQVILRVALLILVVGTAWWAVDGVSRVIYGPRNPTNSAESDHLGSVELTPMPRTSRPSGGVWQSADGEFGVGTLTLTPSELDQLLGRLAVQRFADAAPMTDGLQRVVDFMRSSGVAPQRRGQNLVYRLVGDAAVVQAVTRTGEEGTRLLSLVSAFRSENTWNGLQLVAKQATSTAGDTETSLPMGPNAQPSLARIDNAGRPVLELIHVDAQRPDLLERWRSEGWEVVVNPAGAPGQFDYLCARGHHVLRVWSPASTERLERLFLVHLPDNAAEAVPAADE
jgi:hypothetical protein